MAEMSCDEWSSVQAARETIADYLRKRHPPRTAVSLYCVAISGAFADMLSGSTGAADLVAVINQQLVHAGYEVRKLERN